MIVEQLSFSLERQDAGIPLPASWAGMTAPASTFNTVSGMSLPAVRAGTTVPETEHLEPLTDAGMLLPASRAGISAPVSQGFKNDPRPALAFDWSAGNLDCTFDGETVFSVKTVEHLAAQLNTPHKIVCEASFESFVPGRRHAMAAMLREAGHELYVFRPTATEKFRRKNSIEKSNTNDSQVIYRIATETETHTYPLLAPDPDWVERRIRLNKEYFLIKMTKRKPELLIKPAKKILGWFSKLPPETKLMYGNGKADKYSETLLAAVYFATLNTTNRYDFERVLGLWESAHPSLLRSDIHHHGYKAVRKRGVTMSEYRKAARNLRAVFIAAGVGK